MKGLYENNKESIMTWRNTNKEVYLEYMKKYNKEHQEDINKKMRDIYHANGGKEKKRLYYLKKKEMKLKQQETLPLEEIPTTSI